MSREDYKTLELVRRAKANDQKAFNTLLRQVEPELEKIARQFYIQGGDSEDVIQEGRLGVWKAVQDFNPDMNMTFKNFAIGLCVRRHLITAIAAANRNKHRPQNRAISINCAVTTDDENEQTLADFIEDDSPTMLSQVIDEETFQEMFREILRTLTQLEAAVFREFVFHEESYRTIGQAVDCDYKCVDNAMMRIRKKAKPVIAEYRARQRRMEELEEV